jgi:hypothetical protein
MTILQANFKHLYQRRSFWLLWPLLGFLAFLIINVAAKGRAASFPAFIILMLLFGAFAASLQNRCFD